MGLILGPRRSSGEGNGNPFQYPCLHIPMDRGAWWATVHGVPKSWTRLGDLHYYTVYNTVLYYLYTTYWRRKWQPTPVLLPGKSHGWRSMLGYSPWGSKEWDTPEQLNFHFHILYTHLQAFAS